MRKDPAKRMIELNGKKEAIFKKMEDPAYEMTDDEQDKFVSTWFKDKNPILNKYIQNSITFNKNSITSKKNLVFVNKYKDFMGVRVHHKKKAADTTTKAAADTFDFTEEELVEKLAMIENKEKEEEDKKNAASNDDVDTDSEEKDDARVDTYSEEKDDESKEEKDDVDIAKEEEDEPIKYSLQTMLTKLPSYDVNKTEDEYKKEYIKNNNTDGELFTYEEAKEVEQRVGGRTQKKKKKRVQNRRRQKTIKNKV